MLSTESLPAALLAAYLAALPAALLAENMSKERANARLFSKAGLFSWNTGLFQGHRAVASHLRASVHSIWQTAPRYPPPPVNLFSAAITTLLRLY